VIFSDSVIFRAKSAGSARSATVREHGAARLSESRAGSLTKISDRHRIYRCISNGYHATAFVIFRRTNDYIFVLHSSVFLITLMCDIISGTE
jgi:hypothetical protein